MLGLTGFYHQDKQIFHCSFNLQFLTSCKIDIFHILAICTLYFVLSHCTLLYFKFFLMFLICELYRVG